MKGLARVGVPLTLGSSVAGTHRPVTAATRARGRQSKKLVFCGTYREPVKFDTPRLHQILTRGYGAIRDPAVVFGRLLVARGGRRVGLTESRLQRGRSLWSVRVLTGSPPGRLAVDPTSAGLRIST